MVLDGHIRSRLHPSTGLDGPTNLDGRDQATLAQDRAAPFVGNRVASPPVEPNASEQSFEDRVADEIAALFHEGIISLEECLSSIARLRSGS